MINRTPAFEKWSPIDCLSRKVDFVLKRLNQFERVADRAREECSGDNPYNNNKYI